MTEQRKEVPRFLSEGLAKCEVSRKSRFLHPYLQLFISVVLTGAAQIFLKLGVDSNLMRLGRHIPFFSLPGSWRV